MVAFMVFTVILFTVLVVALWITDRRLKELYSLVILMMEGDAEIFRLLKEILKDGEV